jgi:hypothetical protein
MAKSSRSQAISHQTVRLGPGRHPRPGKVVCVMELASMLAGDRFGDRPASVCPVVGAILRTYNDNIDSRRRHDLYRFAADAVNTRRDYRVQRRRADAALDWARARYQARGCSADKLPAAPDPDGERDEIAFYVVGSLLRGGPRRGRWSDEAHGAIIALLEELIEMDGELAVEPLVTGALVAPAAVEPLVDDALAGFEAVEPLIEEAAFELLIGKPLAGDVASLPLLGEPTAHPILAQTAFESLLGDLVEHASQPVEHRSGNQQVLVAEPRQRCAEPRLVLGAASLDEGKTAVGERSEHDPAIALGTDPLDEPRRGEPFEHLGDARWAQIGRVREVAQRQLTLVAKAEQQAVLRVGELARTLGLAPTHPSNRGHGSLERSRDLLGGVALVALAYHVAKRL